MAQDMELIDHGLIDGVEDLRAVHCCHNAVWFIVVDADVEGFEVFGEVGQRSEISGHGFLYLMWLVLWCERTSTPCALLKNKVHGVGGMVTHRAVEETSASSLIVMSPSSSSRSSRPSTDLGTSSTPMSETTESKAMYRPIIQDFPVASRIISEIMGAKAPPMIEPSA